MKTLLALVPFSLIPLSFALFSDNSPAQKSFPAPPPSAPGVEEVAVITRGGGLCTIGFLPANSLIPEQVILITPAGTVIYSKTRVQYP